MSSSLGGAPKGGGKRLALVLPDMRPGGAERVALRLARDFVGAGHEVDLVLLSAHGELLSLLPRDVRVFDLGARRIRHGLLPMARYLRQRKPHAVQVLMWPLTVLGVIAHRLARSNARLILAEHTMPSHHFATSAARLLALRVTMRASYGRAHARVAVSNQAAADIAGLTGLPQSSIDVIYNPVERPPVARGATDDIDRLWGEADDRILSVGSLKPEKNHKLLISAFARLDRPRAKLMILGEGQMRGELEALARHLGVADRVIMPGFALDPWPYYRSAGLFVLSSDYEGYPLVLVEAMRAGLPVVSTDCDSGPREILEDGRYGSLVPCSDTERLADAMAVALSGQFDAEGLKQRAEEISGTGTSERYLQLMLGPTYEPRVAKI
jgi:glycosyltransferase involved in cell wall biosynthesis